MIFIFLTLALSVNQMQYVLGLPGLKTNAYIAGIYNTMPGGIIQNVIVNKQWSFRIDSVSEWLEFPN